MRAGLLLGGLLPMASLWGAAPAATLAVSSASVLPGGSAALSVTLVAPDGAKVSGVQWTIRYSSSSISGVSVQAGASAAAAGKTAQCLAGPDPGIRRCLVYGLNQSVMAPGPIAVLVFHVAANAPSSSIPVGISELIMTEPAGNPIPIDPPAAGGMISVVQPGASPIHSLTCTPASIASPGVSSCTVALSAPAPSGGLAAVLSSADPAVTVPPSVNIAGGAASASFTATVAPVASNLTALITAAVADVSRSFSLNITAQPGLPPPGCAPANISWGPVTTCTLALTSKGAAGAKYTEPVSTGISLSNAGAAVQYEIYASSNWIIPSKSHGTLPLNGTDSFTIHTLPLNLPSGIHYGTVILSAADRPQVVINLTMDLTGSGQPTQLNIFPTQLDFFVESGLAPLGQGLQVAAGDASAANVNVLPSSGGWLAAAPGTVVTPGLVAVNVTSTPSSLPQTGTISLAPSSQNLSSGQVPVNLRSAGAKQYSIPRIVDGGGFATTITISNLDTAPAIVSLRLRRVLTDKTTVPWTPLMEGGQATEDVPIPVGGSITWRTSGLGSQVDAGWAQVISARRIGGFAVYRQRVDGRADQEAAVPIVSTWQQRFLVPVDNTGSLVTSIAVTNTSETEPGDVQAMFRDENGQVIPGSYRLNLPPQGHFAFATADELPFLRNRRATADFVMLGGRMSAVGLRFSSSAFTSFEVQSLNTSSFGRLIIPQVANAGGFVTTITLVNKEAEPALLSLRFYRQTGSHGSTEAWNPPIAGDKPTQNVTIQPGSSITWETTGAGNLEQGWAEVITSSQVSGFAVFLQRIAGRADQEAAVPVSAGPQIRFLLPYDNTQSFTTSMALASFSPESQAVVAATVRDDRNTIVGEQTVITLPAHGHLAFPLPQQFPQSAGRRGTIEFHVPTGSVSVLGLRFAGESFTSFTPQVIQ
ncbi:MAG: hypothetical protein HXY18_13515 [Bryobacteraceae bacterium]|nr:hypothetical protein [Bryobacteraceae bacterium]